MLLAFEIGLESAAFYLLAGLDVPLSLQLALLHLKPKLGALLDRQTSAPTVRHLGFQIRFAIIFLLQVRLCLIQESLLKRRLTFSCLHHVRNFSFYHLGQLSCLVSI